MDLETKGDVELGTPAVSTGPDDRPKSKQKTKMATTGGGSDKRRKAKPPPPPNNTKKIVLASGVLLCVVSLVAIIMVLSGNYGSSYNMSIPQFQGELQMEEMNGEMVTWSDDYNDLSSPKSRSLTQALTRKLTAAFKEEGVEIDEVIITNFAATEPKTVLETKLKSGSAQEGRSVFSSMEGPKQQGDGNAMFSPSDINNMEVETIEHADVSYVTMQFETKGTPTKNAAVFTSANGQWSSVSNMIESRMASEGMGVKIDEIKPEPQFMDSVYKALKETPSLLRAHAPPQSAPAEICACETSGYHISPKSKICKCESSCVVPYTYVYGGTDNIFAVYSNICLAAYYAGLIGQDGGTVEAIDMNTGKISSGGVKNGITPWTVPYEIRIYKLKKVGPVIDTLKPTGSISGGQAGGGDDVGGGIPAVVTGENMFTMYLHYKTVGGSPTSFVPSMANVKSSEATQFTDQVISKIQTAVSSQGFVIGGVVANEIIDPPSKTGLILGVDIKGDFGSNVENAVRLEGMQPGSVPSKIIQSMGGDDVKIRAFRYSKAFLAKMTRHMEKTEGQSAFNNM